MKNKIFVSCLVLIIILVALTGCIEGENDYETVSHPTKISYTVNYGYFVNNSGSGNYHFKYDCDLPELTNGLVLSTSISGQGYVNKTVATHNDIISWDVNTNINKNYKLGISSEIISESFLIQDLNGVDALSIEEIKENYDSLIVQYCNAQIKDNTAYIDPNNNEIKNIAENILSSLGSNNSFVIAKEIFIWLKQNTNYKINSGIKSVKPCDLTLQSKSGDCDDLSFLYISLCRSIEIPSRFIRGYLVNETKITPHAWVEVFVGGGIGKSGWIPVECAGNSNDIQAEVYQKFGLESANHLRLFKDDGTNESLNSSITGLYYTTNLKPESYKSFSDYVVLESNELIISEDNVRTYS